MEKRKLFVIFLTVFIDLVGFGIIIPISPYLARQFDASPVQIGILMALYSAMQFLFSPVWGRLSDRMGRRPILLLSIAGVGIAHLMFSFANTIEMLYVSRALAGIFGANISTAMAVVADVTGTKDRSKSMGLIGAAFGLGFIFGPLLGGIFAQIGFKFGFEPPFGPSFAAVGAALLSLINFIFTLTMFKETLPPEKRSQVQARRNRWASIAEFFKIPAVGSLMFSFFLTTLAMAHIENQLFLFMQDEHSWDLETASLGFAYCGLIMVITQGWLVRRLFAKWGERNLLVIGLILAAFGFALIPNAHIAVVTFAVTLMSLGIGFINPSISGSISLLTPQDRQGEALGANQSFSALGRVVGPAAGGWFYQEISHSFPFIMAGLLTGVALLLCLRVLKQIPTSGRGA